METLVPDKIEKVLVVTAHPDDSEFGAGGTIAKLVRDGCEVSYVVVTNGNKGSGDRTMTSERLARIREEEQRNAARTLGVARVAFLGYPDCEVEDTRELRRDVTRETAPTTWAVLTATTGPSPGSRSTACIRSRATICRSRS
jgi:LmbE family N-acetylglucosaminyl deacetylase